MITLPLQTLPAQPADALVAALMAIHQHRPTRPGLLDPPLVAALLALAGRTPFDPNARVPHWNQGAALSEPLLTYIVRHAPLGALPHPRRWPSRPEDFGEGLWIEGVPGAQQVDAEWLAAAVLAAGADPWSDRSPEQPLGSALAAALAANMPGLVHRLLDMPGAPSPQEVAQTPWTNTPGNALAQRMGTGAHHAHWWAALTAQPYHTAVCATLLERGLRPTEALAPALEDAAPASAVAMARYGWLPTAAPALKRLREQWRRRLKSGNLDSESFTALETVVQTPGGPPMTAAQAAAVAVLTSREWGGLGDGAIGTQDLTDMLARVHLPAHPREPWEGQWSGLALQMARALRRWNLHGVAVWEARQLMGPFAREAELPTMEEAAGRLAPALGFEWRPGVAIDGVAVLALVGMDDKQHNRGQWIANAHCLGLDDPLRWACRHMPDAVVFTEAVLAKQTKREALERFQTIWAEVARKIPMALNAHPDHAVRLLRALNRKGWQSLKDDLVGAMTPLAWLDSTQGPVGVLGMNAPPPLSGLPEPLRALAVEITLALKGEHSQGWWEAVLQAGREGALDQASRARLKEWALEAKKGYPSRSHHHYKQPEAQPWQRSALAEIQGWDRRQSLEQALPTSPSPPKRAGPRL